MWKKKQHGNKTHPMVASGDPFHVSDGLWNSGSQLTTPEYQLDAIRINVTTFKKTASTFRQWRHKTFTEKELQKQDGRKGETPRPRKKTKAEKIRNYLFGTMPGWSKKVAKYPIVDFVDYNLRGSGQVIFCNNSITGLFILGAIFLGAPWIGTCATIGLVASTSTALLLSFNKGAIRAGLFGYNGVLVGAALGTFLGNGTWSGSTVVAILIMSMFSTFISAAIGTINSTWKVPAFTLPFNLSAIIFMLGVYHFLHYAMLPDIQGGFSLSHGVETNSQVWRAQLPLAVLRGVSQVWLINNEYSGIVILVGMAFCSPISSAFALVGSAVGLVSAVALGVDAQEIFAGLWGYNAVLGCVAMGGVFYILSVKVAFLALMCGILCTILLGTFKGLFATLGMPAFTFPFCLGTIVFILIQPALPDVIPMPLPSITTPEQHIRLLKITKRAIHRMEQNVLLARKRKARPQVTPAQTLVEVITPREVDHTPREGFIPKLRTNYVAHAKGDLKGDVEILNQIVGGGDTAMYTKDDVEELTPREENVLVPRGEPRD
eukprot:Phypoly_transcript_06120.p1 GENE.Phypoly_transcript_06120~~Phypoly_transcript_06120.p1  ORF type:complete len:546 (+),score=77.49 Phypoly_transcript_06120:117-1754(+)